MTSVAATALTTSDTLTHLPVNGHGRNVAPERIRNPLSALWGDMPGDEFSALVENIRKNGLLNPVVTADDGSILDGWHRYRACLASGIEPRFETFAAESESGKTMTPAEFVVAQNAHRRHLTRAQRHLVVAELLKSEPQLSNRSIARSTHVDDKTVGAVRATLEAGAEIPQVTEARGRDGKTYRRPKAKAESASGNELQTVINSENTPQTARAKRWIDPPMSDSERETAVGVLRHCADAIRGVANGLSRCRLTPGHIRTARKKMLGVLDRLDQFERGGGE